MTHSHQPVRRVAVFCGSANGTNPAFVAEARALGAAIAAAGLGLVYGGACVGLMGTVADAFLVLPGGYGTMDEMVEVVTWAQLGLHTKPCILINTAGYWDGLLAFLDTAVAAGFVKAKNRELVRMADSAKEAVRMAIHS